MTYRSGIGDCIIWVNHFNALLFFHIKNTCLWRRFYKTDITSLIACFTAKRNVKWEALKSVTMATFVLHWFRIKMPDSVNKCKSATRWCNRAILLRGFEIFCQTLVSSICTRALHLHNTLLGTMKMQTCEAVYVTLMFSSSSLQTSQHVTIVLKCMHWVKTRLS